MYARACVHVFAVLCDSIMDIQILGIHGVKHAQLNGRTVFVERARCQILCSSDRPPCTYADFDKWVFISKGFKNLNIICVGYSPELKHSTEI